MARFRLVILALSMVFLVILQVAPTNAEDLSLFTSERQFSVTSFTSPGAHSRSAVVVLGGARGYKAKAYARLGSALNAAGIDMFLVHYISSADMAALERFGSASGRISYYGKRMDEWREAVRSTIAAIRSQNIYKRAKIGVLGISLGAMPVLAETANSSTIDASVAVDGGFPATFKTTIRSMPPFMAVWGGNDQVFSLSTGKSIHEKASSLGGRSEILVYRGEEHTFFLREGNANARKARNAIAAFFSRYLTP